MNRPTWTSYALGNGPAAALLTLASAMLIYRGWALGDTGAVIVGGGVLVVTGRAHARLLRYRRWKREWDSISGEPVTPSSTLPKRVVGAIILGIIVAHHYARNDNAANGQALIWLVGSLAVAAVCGLVRAFKRRRAARPKHNREVVPVAVCVTRPLIDTPPLQIAYQRLPEHCQRLLAHEPKRC